MRALILAASLLIGFGGAAWSQVEKDLTGMWSGTFALVSLSDKAGFGPSQVFEGKMRESDDQAVKTRKGEVSLEIMGEVGGHFHGKWTIKKDGARFTCSLMDDTNFVCGSPRGDFYGILHDTGAMRLCWGSGGKHPSSGCAELVKQ